MEHFENPILTASGDERTILWHNAVLHDSEGAVSHVVASGVGITDRVRLECEQREALARAVPGLLLRDPRGDRLIASQEQPFAAVVADMSMPVMNGILLLQRVERASPDTIRLMLTGHAAVGIAMKAVNDGMGTSSAS